MEYQNIINLLNDALNQPSELKTKNRVKIKMMNHKERITKLIKLDLKL